MDSIILPVVLITIPNTHYKKSVELTFISNLVTILEIVKRPVNGLLRNSNNYGTVNPFATVIVFFVDFCVCRTIIVPYPANVS